MTYDDLVKKIDRYKRLPQNYEAEFALVLLEWIKEDVDARRTIKVLRLAKILFEAFWKNGQATVIFPSGRQLTEYIPKGSGVSLIWNTKYRAREMANLVTPWDRP